MAIDHGTATLTLTKSERTWRVEIFCERNADPVVRAHRESIWTDPDGNVVKQERGTVTERHLSQVATESHLGLTATQLAGMISARADLWREQDLTPTE